MAAAPCCLRVVPGSAPADLFHAGSSSIHRSSYQRAATRGTHQISTCFPTDTPLGALSSGEVCGEPRGQLQPRRGQRWVVNTHVDLGAESRAARSTLTRSATAPLTRICGQGAVFSFTWSMWWHCPDSPPAAQQQTTGRHSRYRMRLAQKFPIQFASISSSS